MNEKKSRALLFALGISIGLLVGATAVYLTLPKPNENGAVSENMIEQIVNKVYGLISTKKEAQDSLSTGKDEMLNSEKSKQVITSKNKKEEPAIQPDSIANAAKLTENKNDSLQRDSIANATLAALPINDDIVVRKDELIISKAVELINMDFASTKATGADSLLPIISGIRDNSKMNEAKYLYQVELWRSPINYKGYKLSKNKLILFGMDEDAPLKLFYISDKTYLKCAEQFYKLDANTDFKAFEKVANPMVAVSK